MLVSLLVAPVTAAGSIYAYVRYAAASDAMYARYRELLPGEVRRRSGRTLLAWFRQRQYPSIRQMPFHAPAVVQNDDLFVRLYHRAELWGVLGVLGAVVTFVLLFFAFR